MKINKDSLSSRAHNISKKMNISANIVYSKYFFDCFLTRLAASPYSNKFVLKGGLYLSSILGIENRFTADIDFIVIKLSLEHDSIIKIIKEICTISVDDNVTFTFISDSAIKKDDIYGGISVTIEGKLENVRELVDIDIATNDIVYPKDCDHSYKCLLTGEILQLKSYSIESVIAEKMQTFLSKGVTNSRAKDLYDLYVLEKLEEKDSTNLKIAFLKTCEHRSFIVTKEYALKTLNLVKSNLAQKQRWFTYSNKMKYANNIPFDNVITSIGKLIDLLF